MSGGPCGWKLAPLCPARLHLLWEGWASAAPRPSQPSSSLLCDCGDKKWWRFSDTGHFMRSKTLLLYSYHHNWSVSFSFWGFTALVSFSDNNWTQETAVDLPSSYVFLSDRGQLQHRPALNPGSLTHENHPIILMWWRQRRRGEETRHVGSTFLSAVEASWTLCRS